MKDRLAELADFLRTRRARLAPESVGLPKTSRRRTPGLRREEVAELASISVTWYTWLEQGRRVSISSSVALRIAKALRLNESEQAHFFKLLAQPYLADLEMEQDPLDPGISSILQGLQFHPVFVLNHRWDLLSWNRCADFIWRFSTVNSSLVNFLHFYFMNQHMRNISTNWESDARDILAQFRLDYDRHVGEDSRFEPLVNMLRTESVEFNSWWGRHDVIQRTGFIKEMNHPMAGQLSFKSIFLERSGAPFPRIIVYNPTAASLAAIEKSL